MRPAGRRIRLALFQEAGFGGSREFLFCSLRLAGRPRLGRGGRRCRSGRGWRRLGSPGPSACPGPCAALVRSPAAHRVGQLHHPTERTARWPLLPRHALRLPSWDGTGGTSGVYYPLGVAISKIYGEKIPSAKTQVQATKASVENLNLLQQGRGVDQRLAGRQVMRMGSGMGMGHGPNLGGSARCCKPGRRARPKPGDSNNGPSPRARHQ